MINAERYKIKLETTMEAHQIHEKSKTYQNGFIAGYYLGTRHGSSQGLTEGWNDHIKKLAQLMEPLGGKRDE